MVTRVSQLWNIINCPGQAKFDAWPGALRTGSNVDYDWRTASPSQWEHLKIVLQMKCIYSVNTTIRFITAARKSCVIIL